jgi:putative oxidoreductase
MGMVQSMVGFLGRALLSIIFISSGINKVTDWHGTQQFFNHALNNWLSFSTASPYCQAIVEWAIANSALLLLLGVLFEIVGGIFVFFGLWVRLGALLLFIFMIPTTLVFHDFWHYQAGERMGQMINFMKNVSISGGLLVLLALGKGGKPSNKKSEKAA